MPVPDELKILILFTQGTSILTSPNPRLVALFYLAPACTWQIVTPSALWNRKRWRFDLPWLHYMSVQALWVSMKCLWTQSIFKRLLEVSSFTFSAKSLFSNSWAQAWVSRILNKMYYFISLTWSCLALFFIFLDAIISTCKGNVLSLPVCQSILTMN